MGKTPLGEIASNIFFLPGTRKKYMSSIQPESGRSLFSHPGRDISGGMFCWEGEFNFRHVSEIGVSDGVFTWSPAN